MEQERKKTMAEKFADWAYEEVVNKRGISWKKINDYFPTNIIEQTDTGFDLVFDEDGSRVALIDG